MGWSSPGHRPGATSACSAWWTSWAWGTRCAFSATCRRRTWWPSTTWPTCSSSPRCTRASVCHPLEAMACGLPVVASTAPALREVLDGAALLVQPQDVAGLAEAMAAALGDEPRRVGAAAGGGLAAGRSLLLGAHGPRDGRRLPRGRRWTGCVGRGPVGGRGQLQRAGLPAPLPGLGAGAHEGRLLRGHRGGQRLLGRERPDGGGRVPPGDPHPSARQRRASPPAATAASSGRRASSSSSSIPTRSWPRTPSRPWWPTAARIRRWASWGPSS